MSFAIGYFTIANRRDILFGDFELNRIAGVKMRGLDYLLQVPIRPDLAIAEFKDAFNRLGASIDPESEMADRLRLSDLYVQLQLLSSDMGVDVETVDAVVDVETVDP